MLVGRGRRVTMLRADDFGWIGARFWPELLYPAVEHFGEIQVAILIGGDRVRPVELARLPARSAPPVEILAVQVVLENPVGAAVGHPDRLIGGDDVRVR